jgi:hypothetical protein
MRKLLISLLAVSVLGAGSAFAQSGFWAGASVGFPNSGIHFGVENVVQDLDLRVNVGTTFALAFSVGVDVLYNLALDTGMLPLDTYVGGGVNLGVGLVTGINVGLFGGVEYRLAEVGLPQGGVFFEVGPSVSIPFVFGVLGRLGFNYHF